MSQLKTKKQERRKEMKQKFAYIVVALDNEAPRIIGVYANRQKAEAAIPTAHCWCNVIKKEIIE